MNSNPMYMEYVDDADPQPAAPRRGWRILGWVCIGLSAVMVAGSLTAYGLYRKAFGNISHEDVNAQLGPNRPKKLNSAMNILLLGSDTRAGANGSYGRGMKDEAPRSDTMILLHLSPGGGQAMGISFPRDLMVQMPSCKTKTGGTVPAQSRAQINSAFTNGGAGCVMKTIESITNIRIDHFMQVDFTGFKSITNAVGGVPVCLPENVDDPKSKLKLTKGKHVIKGETALAYVRVRHIGDGSDTARIKRQQKFMGALANRAMSAGVLTNPAKLLSLMNAATKSLTTDKELTPQVLMRIGGGMQGMTSGKLRFVTAPSGPDPLDKNRVALTPAAQPFFASIRNDKSVPSEPKHGTAPKIQPSQVRVRVFNSSGITGKAKRVADDLQAQGFQVSVGGNAPTSQVTKVQYGSGADQQSGVLTALIPSKPQATPRTTGALPGVVDLFVGSDWTALKSAKVGIPKQAGEIKADDDICKDA